MTAPHNSTLDGYFVTFRGWKRVGRWPEGIEARTRKTTGLGMKRLDISTSGWILGDKLAVPARVQGAEKGPARRLSHDRLEGARKVARYIHLCVRSCARVLCLQVACVCVCVFGD